MPGRAWCQWQRNAPGTAAASCLRVKLLGPASPSRTCVLQKFMVDFARTCSLFLLAPIFAGAFVLTGNPQIKTDLKDKIGIPRFNQANICRNSKEGHRLGTRPCSASMSSSSDLLVVGAGYLGGMLVSEYKSIFPTARIIAETRSVFRVRQRLPFQITRLSKQDHLEARTAQAERCRATHP